MSVSRRKTRRSMPASKWCRRAAASAAAILAISGGARSEPCVLSTGQTAVTIGEPTAVCIVVNNLVWEVNGTSKYSQVLITPDADDFSRFSISGSWNSSNVDLDPILTIFGTDIGVHIESVGKYSFQKAFRRHELNKTFPLHTAIIAVDEGEVTGISWDDGCHFCGSSNCEENTYEYAGNLTEDSGQDCFWPDSICLEEDVEGSVSSLCQLTVYVVWTGTDSKGNYFTSFSKRLSMYADEALDDLVGDAKTSYQATIVPAD